MFNLARNHDLQHCIGIGKEKKVACDYDCSVHWNNWLFVSHLSSQIRIDNYIEWIKLFKDF